MVAIAANGVYHKACGKVRKTQAEGPKRIPLYSSEHLGCITGQCGVCSFCIVKMWCLKIYTSGANHNISTFSRYRYRFDQEGRFTRRPLFIFSRLNRDTIIIHIDITLPYFYFQG
jgi:hypothetical protein